MIDYYEDITMGVAVRCECGNLINEKRLQLYPEIKLCIECQQDLERSGKFRRHRMEIHQNLVGWQCDSIETRLIRGD